MIYGYQSRYRITRVVTPATSLLLVTLDQAKTALDIPLSDHSQDAQLNQRIAATSAAVQRYCDRIFPVQTYRDQFRYATRWLGMGDPLHTRAKPIVLDGAGVPMVTITEDGTELAPGAFDTDLEIGAFYRLDVPWLGQTVVVEYTAGFNPIPPDVQSATLEWLRTDVSAAGRDPALRSETAEGIASFTYFDWAGSSSSAMGVAAPPSAAKLLLPYLLISM